MNNTAKLKQFILQYVDSHTFVKINVLLVEAVAYNHEFVKIEELDMLKFIESMVEAHEINEIEYIDSDFPYRTKSLITSNKISLYGVEQ